LVTFVVALMACSHSSTSSHSASNSTPEDSCKLFALVTEAHNLLAETRASTEDLKRRTQRLAGALAASCEELAELRRCLAESGLLCEVQHSARLHRQRFDAMRRTSGWTSDVRLEHLFTVSDICFLVSSQAGADTVRTLHETSRDAESFFPPRLYVCGGAGETFEPLTSLECFNPKTGVWTALPPMSAPRADHAAVAISGCLYVCGGRDGARTLSSTERFDPWKRGWESLAPMRVWRKAHVAAAIAGELYACGGDGMGQIHFEAERFSPGQLPGRDVAWDPLPPMRERRSWSAAAATGGRLYVCGGFDGLHFHSSAERFDPRRNVWEEVPQMRTRRCGHAASVVGGQLVVCGGFDGAQVWDSVETFHPGRGIWEFLPSPMSAPRHRPAMVALAGQLYVCGGYSCPPELRGALPGVFLWDSVERFDHHKGTWETISPMTAARGGLAGARIAV